MFRTSCVKLSILIVVIFNYQACNKADLGVSATDKVSVSETTGGGTSGTSGGSTNGINNSNQPLLENIQLLNGLADGFLNAKDADENLSIAILESTNFDTVMFSVVESIVTCNDALTYVAALPLAGADIFADGTEYKLCAKLIKNSAAPLFVESEMFIVDKTPPQSPAPVMLNAAASGKLNLQGKSSTLPIVDVNLADGEHADFALASDASQCTSALNFEAAPPKPNHSDFIHNASKVICVRVSDKAGNYSYGSSQTIFVDTMIPSAPTLISSAFADNIITAAENVITGFPVQIVGEANASYTLTCENRCSIVSGGTLSSSGSSSSGELNSSGSGTVFLRAVSDGSFSFNVVLKDASENASLSVSRTLSASLAPSSDPIVELGAPSQSVVTPSGSVTFPVSITGASSISLTSSAVSKGTTGSAQCSSLSVADGTTDSPTITLSSCSGTGTITISINAGIAANSDGDFSDAVGPSDPVTVASSAPIFSSLAFVGGASDGFLNASDVLIFTLNASNYISAKYAVVTGSATCNGTLSYSSMLPIASDFSDGTGKICVQLQNTDGVFNYGYSSTLNVDKTAPTISVSSPTPATVNASQTVSYTITFSDGSGSIASVDLSGAIHLMGNSSGCNLTVSGSGLTSRTVEITGCSASNGMNSIAIDPNAILDSAGNGSAPITTSPSFTVSNPPADEIEPSVSIIGPLGGVTHANQGSSPFEYNVSFMDNVEAYSVDVDLFELDEDGTNCSMTIEGPASHSYTVRISNCSGDGTVGIKTLLGAATDAAGNQSPETASINRVTIDNSAPTVTIGASSPAAGTSFNSPTVIGSPLSGSCEVGLQVTLGGDANAMTTLCSNGTYTFNLWSFAGSPPAPGSTASKTVILSHTDSAGNVGTVSRTFTLSTPSFP